MRLMLITAWHAIQRFPRVSLIVASFLVFSGARHFVNAHVRASMNQTDPSPEELVRCSSNSSCSSHPEETGPSHHD